MITPYNPSRGVDLYLDASGDDNWKADPGRYYLLGLMACGASAEWRHWMNMHAAKYGGLIHWSKGEYGNAGQKLVNVKEECRDLLAKHPWLLTGIYVFDKNAFMDFVRAKLRRPVTESEAVKKLWQIPAVGFLKLLMPRLKEMVPGDDWGSLNLRNVVFNNPQGGDKGLIKRIIEKEFARTPQFVPAGHYGIDALDGVLWAFQRYFNSGKKDCLPDSTDDFRKDLNVVVLGLKSNEPKLLRNSSEVEAFKTPQ